MLPMLRISDVRPLEGRVVQLTLTDGSIVERDLSALLDGVGIFERISFDDAAFREVYVDYGTLAWPGDVDLSKENDPSAKVKELAMQQREWMPLLQIGSKQIHQASFTDQGIVNEKPDLDALGKTGKTARSIAAKAADAPHSNQFRRFINAIVSSAMRSVPSDQTLRPSAIRR